MDKSKVHFRVSGKITRLLGRESVSESITALFEVLKNSHDADAISTIVQLKDILSGAGKIVLKEKKGDGMTLEEITQKFFVIGTYAKESKDGTTRETKRFQRRMLGNKGVGRFALERLGREVKIVSKPINSNQKFTFTIDWDKFTDREITVDQVGIDVIQEEREVNEDSGLDIEISRLNDEWNVASIRRLESKIQRLILPKEFQPKNAFNIILDAPEFGYNQKEIRVDLLQRAYYYLKADLFEDRIKITAKIKNNNVISTTHKNDLITEFVPYHYGAKITKSEEQHGIKNIRDLTCGPVQLIVYYFPIFQKNSPENRDAIRYYGEVFGQLIDSELPKHSGIRVFRDGMREFTYGDPNNDWAERASISRNMSGTVQADRLIGYTMINNQQNRGIISTTNRETAIQNQAFQDLKEFVIQSMLHFDRHLNSLRRKMLEERKDIKKDVEAVDQLKIIKKNLTAKDSPITKAFKKVLDLTGEDYSGEVGQFLDAIDNAQSRLEEKIESVKAVMTVNQIEKSLASLGVIVSMMIHEVNDNVRISHRESKKLKSNLKNIKNMNALELSRIVTDLSNSLERVHAWSELVDAFSSNLTLEDIHSRTENIINPLEITEKFVNQVKKILGVPTLNVDIKISKNLQIQMFPAYFESIIGNLFSNALKAIAYDDEEEIKPKIIIQTEKSPEQLNIYVSDNGPGIPKERWESVFEPHITSTTKFKIFKGHGLGLPIVHSMVRSYDGEIKIIDSIQARGTTFKISFPWDSIKPGSRKMAIKLN